MNKVQILSSREVWLRCITTRALLVFVIWPLVLCITSSLIEHQLPKDLSADWWRAGLVGAVIGVFTWTPSHWHLRDRAIIFCKKLLEIL